jgi:hypothetical protein
VFSTKKKKDNKNALEIERGHGLNLGPHFEEPETKISWQDITKKEVWCMVEDGESSNEA